MAYVTVADAEILLQALPASPGVTDWLALTEDQKTKTLAASTAVLDSLDWAGRKCSCDQVEQWPRLIRSCPCPTNCDSIPHDIELACAYLAAYMGEGGGFLSFKEGASQPSSTQQLEPFDEVKVGPITVKMKEELTYGDQFATNIGQIPPFVADLIRRYLNPFGMTEGRLNRVSTAQVSRFRIGSSAYSGRFYLRNGRVYPRFGGWGC